MTGKPELDTRKRVYDLVVHAPGTHLREIERQTGLPLGVVRYHLDYLQREGLIFAEEDRYFKRFFPKDRIPNVPTETIAVLRQESLRRLVLQLLTAPGSTHAQLMDALGIPGSTLSTYLVTLLKKGTVRRERRGRENRYFLTNEEAVIKVLIVYRPTFLDRLVDRAIALYVERR